MQEQTSKFEIKQPVRTISFDNLTIGSDSSFHFLTENNNKSKPVYALELDIFNTDEMPESVKKEFQNELKNPAEILKKAQDLPCDIIGLKFNIGENEQNINLAKDLLKNLLPLITKPLMIIGINNADIDSKLIPELISALDRESIIAFAEEKTYKSIVPSVTKGNHILSIRTPIDINLAKEMNILTTEMGLSADRILIDTDMGGLGYGLEYGYSIMERIKLAGFDGDKMLNMPIIAFVGEETFKTKETKSDEFSQSWGNLNERAKMFEITSASAITAAGANVIVVKHPQTIKTMKGLV